MSSASKISIFNGSDRTAPPTSLRYCRSDRVTVNAGETLALLLHAARTNRSWLGDFADETLEVSRDMYEVLLAFKRIATEENARAA